MASTKNTILMCDNQTDNHYLITINVKKFNSNFKNYYNINIENSLLKNSKFTNNFNYKINDFIIENNKKTEKLVNFILMNDIELAKICGKSLLNQFRAKIIKKLTDLQI